MKRNLVLPIFLTLVAPCANAAPAASRIDLAKGWSIQSSAKVTQKGDAISTATFRPDGWYPTSVPSTVIAALVNNKVYPDPHFGMNL